MFYDLSNTLNCKQWVTVNRKCVNAVNRAIVYDYVPMKDKLKKKLGMNCFQTSTDSAFNGKRRQKDSKVRLLVSWRKKFN